MSGHPDPHLYMTDNYPSKHRDRLTYEETVIALLRAGWPKNRQVLKIATAVIAAESARDPRAFLAYIDLGVDRHSEEGMKLRKEIDALGNNNTLTTYRQKIKDLGLEVVRADCGLLQIAKSFGDWGEPLTPDITVTELMKSDVNLRRAHHMWKNRGWQPWAAYTTAREGEPEPPYMRFLPYAESAVNEVLNGE